MSHKMTDQFFMKATAPGTLYKLYKKHLLTIDQVIRALFLIVLYKKMTFSRPVLKITATSFS